MASYKVDFCRSSLKDLRRLDKQIVPRILTAIELLGDEPRPNNARKLQGTDHTYRIRVGDYRVVYTVEDILLIISVERIRHRKEAYN